MGNDAGLQDVLHDAADYRVRHVSCGNDRVCVITFASLTDTHDLDQPGFGEEFFQQHGIDAVHVIIRTNVWYFFDDFDAALERIRAVARRYDRVLTYGSSMGGYAAIRFAETLGADVAVAISPQYSVSKRIAPFEIRWRHLTPDNSPVHEEPEHGSAKVAPIVFYDPQDLDARHFRLIAAHYPLTVGIAMPHAGHPAGGMLAETHMLSRAILDIVNGSFDPRALAQELRARRGQSGHYLLTLARRIGPAHMRWKSALAQAAVAAKRDAVYLIYDGVLREKLGDAAACEAQLLEAARVLPNHPAPLRALASFEIRRGGAEAAVKYARQLCAIDPQPHYQRMLMIALAIAGQTSEARGIAAALGSGLLLRASLSGAAFLVPTGALRRWWARDYAIKIEFDMLDEWRWRKNERHRFLQA